MSIEQESISEYAKRAIFSMGNHSRLSRFVERAAIGSELLIGAIGGSVTGGANASSWEKQFVWVLIDQLRKLFPKSKFDLINAGVGATESNYGALRANVDLLDRHPDLVVIDFAVNDTWDEVKLESYEGIVRKSLCTSKDLSVILIFFCNSDCAGAQVFQQRIGYHYDLPMVSMRSAFYDDIIDGKIEIKKILDDVVHPLDFGHEVAGKAIGNIISNYRLMDTEDKEIPPPLISNIFENTDFFQADSLLKIDHDGWNLIEDYKPFLRADKPGAVLRLQATCTAIFIACFIDHAHHGQISVSVDGDVVAIFGAFFSENWRRIQVFEACRGLDRVNHKIEIVLEEDAHECSGNNVFEILGIGISKS